MVFGWFSKSAPEKSPPAPKDFQDTPVHKPTPEEIRAERRSQVMDVVRECMLTAGILSAGYKFKVLEADSAHKQFIVLFDLGTMFHSSTERLSSLEQMIQESALHRYDLEIKTCYWRVIPDPFADHKQAPAEVTSPEPDPRAMARAQLDEIFSKDPAMDSQDPASEFPPTQFSHSLAKLHSNTPKGSGSHLLITGFEETEIANSAFKPSSLKHKP